MPSYKEKQVTRAEARRGAFWQPKSMAPPQKKDPTTASPQTRTERYIETHSKSPWLSFFLTVLLGPLGLFYANWIAALILCFLAIALASTVIVPLICWGIAILIGGSAVSSYNDKIRATAELIAEGSSQEPT